MPVCVPVCVRSARELPEAVGRAAAVGDLIELRLDCLAAEEFEAARPLVAALLAARTRPFIITVRPVEQGGRRALTLEERAVLRANEVAGAHDGELFRADFEDLELDLVEHLRANEIGGEASARDWSRVICSQHDFAGVPADLEHLYERMAATPARVLKIAVHAQHVADCIPVFRLLARARREGRACVAVAMGGAGLLTRVLGPARGAFLTYGALDDARRTAEGQLGAADLKHLYRVDDLDSETQVTGLVGSPVAHSLSPHMHNAAFRALGVNAVYVPLEVRDLGDFMRRLAHPRTSELDLRWRGLSVTAPHKGAVTDYLDLVDAPSREIGAVNTVVASDEGRSLSGYNTDAAAFLAPLDGSLNLRGARVAVLGAGGAARAVLWSLRERGAEAFVFARDAAARRAVETARHFGAGLRPLAGASFDSFDLVVNATPLGTRGAHEQKTPATAAQLRGARVVYDLVYNPAETLLLREARAAGCATLGGLAMLVAQAAAQFKLWTGLEAPSGVMRAAAEEALARTEELAAAGREKTSKGEKA